MHLLGPPYRSSHQNLLWLKGFNGSWIQNSCCKAWVEFCPSWLLLCPSLLLKPHIRAEVGSPDSDINQTCTRMCYQALNIRILHRATAINIENFETVANVLKIISALSCFLDQETWSSNYFCININTYATSDSLKTLNWWYLLHAVDEFFSTVVLYIQYKPLNRFLY